MTTKPLPPQWLDRLGRGLMGLAALGALFAFVSSMAAVRNAGPETVWLETWRMFGFLVFAGMFALLAWKPRSAVGVWELAFGHKAAMAIAALFLIPARDASSAGLVDGVLAVMILIAYSCTRGWLAWRH
jgi:hypothetical protein